MTNFDQLQSRESSENIQGKEQIDSKAKGNYEATISTNADKKFGPYGEKLLAQARAKHGLDANGTTKQDGVQAINDIGRSQQEKGDGNRGGSSYFGDTIKAEQPLPMQRHEALQLEIEGVRQKQNELVSNLVGDYLSQGFGQDIVGKSLQKSDVQQAINSKLNGDPNELFDGTDLAGLSELLITNFDRLPAESKNMLKSQVKEYLGSKLISTNFPGGEKYVDFLQKGEAKIYPGTNKNGGLSMMVEFPDKKRFSVRNGNADNLVKARG